MFFQFAGMISFRKHRISCPGSSPSEARAEADHQVHRWERVRRQVHDLRGGEKMVGINSSNAKGSREKVAVNFLGFHVQHM